MDTMRYDDETRLLEHVKIYSAVLTDWQRDGLDAQHADDLAYFLCDLVLYDALRLLARTAARCLLPSPRPFPVLPWAAMLRSHNALLLLLLWCVRRLPARPPMPVSAKSSCSITTS